MHGGSHVSNWFLTHTPAVLQTLLSAVKGVGASIAERIGPVHIGAAERGLLETIWLLLTSIICVPAVCKLLPGGSPVLGYLVSTAALKKPSKQLRHRRLS